ncbi:hypothetical protein LTR36_003238 [Oleoguttula mirabilis]|uniref:Dynamin-type G domain-containing protein n=1 Tax=Oleoguttula mirabilis TaxID=1507867 RepID=A0AAV9JYX5_9PEZI|nr:hypothetical protein LTR36_003238 [Oleoguttula mirabilis]
MEETPAIADAQAVSQLQSDEQRELLDAIDKLRRENIDADISIPQVVVCGDQSSGKSSVLEAIAQVHFPVGSGTTTRFPTEVILRNAPTSGAKLQLRSDPSDRDPVRKQHIEAFVHKHPFNGPEDFPSIVSEASEYLRAYEPERKFWSDWLRAEVSGPTQPHLTLVDLPGLIQSEGENANPGDKGRIKKMVQDYLSNDRAIVLAVANAVNDVDNQEIIQMVRDAGTAKKRTIGVITKPDRLDQGSDDEKKAIRLARNESLHLGLGWHVLKNVPHERARSAGDRDEEEADFFAKRSWSELGQNHVGVAALRQKLNLHLLACITKDLPQLMGEMERKLASFATRTKQLGDARESEADQRAYLAQIQSRVQRLVEAALEGDYKKSEFEDFFDGTHKKSLRDMINGKSDAFAARIRESGKQYHIYGLASERNIKFADVRRPGISSPAPCPRLNFFAPYTEAPHEQKPQTIVLSDYCKRLRQFMHETRGKNLRRTLTSETVTAVFRQQSVFWESHAQEYVQDCYADTLARVKAAVVHIAGRHTADKLMKTFINTKFDEKIKLLDRKVSELLWPYKHCHPMT